VIPMLLSVSVTGIPFIGADVGGFFGSPCEELLLRWFQLGAFMPFFREHCHRESERREPWMFSKETLGRIRKFIHLRYQLLSYWYTCFYQNHINGFPVMRPLWSMFPNDEELYKIEDQFLVGESLLIKPILDPGVTEFEVAFPKGHTWYNFFDFQQCNHSKFSAEHNSIGVYIKGGSILPLIQYKKILSSVDLKDEPFVFIVAPDKNGRAQGELFIDDGHTFNYQKGKYLYKKLSLDHGVLSSNNNHFDESFALKNSVVLIILLGYEQPPQKVTALNKTNGNSIQLNVSHDASRKVIELRFDPSSALHINDHWEISIE